MASVATAVETGTRSSFATMWGIAKRSLLLIPRVPSTFIPSLLMPTFLTIAFAGAFSGIVLLPGFPAAKAIDWFVPMTTMQGAMFAGITTGMGLARDLENGFYDRLLLAPSSRVSLLGGPLVASVLRCVFPILIGLLLALLGDANLPGGLAGIAALAAACFGLSFVAGCWAVGLALKFKTQQAAPLMQTGVFLSVFLSTAQMPLDLLTGWLETVARFNPMTNILALGRTGFLGEVTWGSVYPGLLSLGGLAAVLYLFAYRSMQRVIP